MQRSDLRQLEPKRSNTPTTSTVSPVMAVPGWIFPVMLGLIMVAGIVGLLIGRGDLGALRQQNEELKEQLRLRTLQQSRRSCDAGATLLTQVRQFLSTGRLELAVGLADTRLTQLQPPLCVDAKVALAGLWYDTSLELLFATPRLEGGDSALDSQLVGRYIELEHKAETYDLPEDRRAPPMATAGKAYNAGLWVLADAAFHRAWATQAVGDSAIVFRYDLLRNWGYHLAHQGGPEDREHAIRILATAQAIADTFHVPKGEACADLKDLGFADCRAPHPDATEPLLATPRQ